MSGDINFGAISEELNNKADLDLANLPDNYDFVVESQMPTEANDYTWYRKYKSGWVEQGGYVYSTTDGEVTVTLPIKMANTRYLISVIPNYTSSTATASNMGAARAAGAWVYESQQTASFAFQKQGGQWYSYWYVAGMAA